MYPKSTIYAMIFSQEQTHTSVKYKTCGGKLSEDRREITLTDGFNAGTFWIWGTRTCNTTNKTVMLESPPETPGSE